MIDGLVLLVGLVVIVVLAIWALRGAAPPPEPETTAAPEDEPAPVPLVAPPPTLSGIPAIRHFFRTNETPIYFVSATAFNLLGIDRWVRNFKFINYYDSFDGWHPNVLVPHEQEPREFSSIEEICNYLLGHKEVVDYVRARGPGGKVAFLMFDEETEQLAEELGLEVAFPAAALRHRMDSKIETTRLGDEAGVPSVPNVMGDGTSYADLLTLSRSAGLGDDLVVQTPYGDSGQTTFFIADEDDWKASASKIVGEPIKVMKRIEPRELAIEGVITRHGTLVGPLMTELTGFPELTPVRRRLVRQRRLARRAHRGPADDRARAHEGDGRTPACRRGTAATSSSISSSTPRRATSGSAS